MAVGSQHFRELGEDNFFHVLFDILRKAVRRYLWNVYTVISLLTTGCRLLCCGKAWDRSYLFPRGNTPCVSCLYNINASPRWHSNGFDIYITSHNAHVPAQKRELYWVVLIYLVKQWM